MELALPASFVDCSNFRQVPDNQEVWADMDTNRSCILEILELTPGAGAAAAEYHFKEIGRVNGCSEEELKVVEVRCLDAAELPAFAAAEFRVLLRGEQLASKFNEKAKNVVQIEILLIRLAAPASADLLLSLNSPIAADPKSSDAAFVTGTESYFADMARSLVLKDPSLFVPM